MTGTEGRPSNCAGICSGYDELQAQLTAARDALERLGLSETMTLPFMPKDNSEGRELLARIDYARRALGDG